MIPSWTRFTVKHRWVMLILWILLVATTVPLAAQVTKHLTTNGFNKPHSQVSWATNSLNDLHPAPSTKPLLIENLSEASAKRIAATHHVPSGAVHRIGNNQSLLMPPSTLSVQTEHQLETALRDRHAVVTEVGQLAIGKKVTHDVSQTLARSGIVALPFLAALLLLVFGSVMSVSLPLIIALAGSEVALAAISIISRHIQLSVFLTDIVSFLALGVGIDYALFISTRFRQNLDDGRDLEAAIVDSMSHAGRSVLYSGIAVALAVATLLLGNDAYWRGLALGGSVAIFAVLLATHTLLPPIMRLLGHGLHWGRIRRPDFHMWKALGRFVTRHPLWSILAGLVILVPFATLSPKLQMSTPANLATMLPVNNPLRLAVEKQQQIQGAGSIAPIAVVVQLPHSTRVASSWDAVSELTAHLEKLPDVASVASPTSLGAPAPLLAAAVSTPERVPPALVKGLKNFTSSRNTRLVVVYVTAKSGPNAARTSRLVGRIDSHLAGWLPQGSRAAAGGLVPVLRNFNLLTQSRIPWIIGSALLVALVVLTAATGSVMQAILGVVFDGLVALATAGFLVFVSNHGLFGFQRQPLDSSITPLIFVLLFGLSMDYEVILLHRIQEKMRDGQSLREAVNHGVATTGAMITGAGMIMVVVFLALLISPLQIMKTMAVGLSFAVLADTWIVRSLLVPSATALLNRFGFWPWRAKMAGKATP
ncbi:MAG: MMPL family transporter [Firmicutes bacterium]|nr:MMPL family transporter [Bacillota bacterium]